MDDDFKSSKPVAKAQEVVPAELNITMKKLMLQQASSRLEEISYGNDNRRNVEA
jgi:hypothetical protein